MNRIHPQDAADMFIVRMLPNSLEAWDAKYRILERESRRAERRNALRRGGLQSIVVGTGIFSLILNGVLLHGAWWLVVLWGVYTAGMASLMVLHLRPLFKRG